MKQKRLILFSILVIGLIFIAVSRFPGKTTQQVAMGLKAPDFEVSDTISGKKVSSWQLSGKVVFINFWATWCPPCKEEMPSIEALYRELKTDDNFVMVTVLYNDSPAAALGYMKSSGYTFPVYSDAGGKSAKNYGVTGVPETYLVDKKGVLRKRVIGGADWNSPEAKEFIRSLLSE